MSLNHYYGIIKYAFFNFPLIALVFTLPFLLLQYKKYGSVPLLRSGVVYSFVLYCMTVYFLVVLPLPSIESVASLTSPYYSLKPYSGLLSQLRWMDFSQPSAWWQFIKSGPVRESFYNVCMLIPLGVYLRYYFKRRWWHTLILGFCASLFLELTQLTGLYGLYPRPYRLFDVTDLMNNTIGTMIGFFITPIFCFFLPSRDTLDARAYENGQKVPAFRRLFAFGLDWLLVGSAVFFFDLALMKINQLTSMKRIVAGTLFFAYLGAFVYFVLLQWICGGRTIGKSAVRLRIVSVNGEKPRFWQLLLHYALVYFLFLPSPVYALYFLSEMIVSVDAVPTYTGLAGAIVFGGIFLVLCVEILMKFLGSKNEFMFGRLSRTRLISTIVPPVLEKEPNVPDSVSSALPQDVDAFPEENPILEPNETEFFPQDIENPPISKDDAQPNYEQTYSITAETPCPPQEDNLDSEFY